MEVPPEPVCVYSCKLIAVSFKLNGAMRDEFSSCTHGF